MPRTVQQSLSCSELLIGLLLLAAPVAAQETDDLVAPVPSTPAFAPAPTPTDAPAPIAAVAPEATPVPASSPEDQVLPAPVVRPVSSSTAPTGIGTPVQPLPLYPHAREVAIGGVVVAGVGYLASVVLGALVYAWPIHSSGACEDCPDLRMMFVPLVGPFIFLAQGQGYADVDVAIPLCIIGGVQVIGLGVFIVAGIMAAVGHANSKKRAFTVALSPDGSPQLALWF